MDQQNQAMAMMDCSVSGLNYTTQTTNSQTNAIYYDHSQSNASLWHYWTDQYYPQVIVQSYPVYFKEKAMDKGKEAFEILKSLMDKKLVKLDKVSDFVEAMDTILKTL